MVAAYAVHHDTSVNIADAYSAGRLRFLGNQELRPEDGLSLAVVPDGAHEGPRERRSSACCSCINAKDRATGAVGPFSDADQHLAESLASQAAIALTNRLLINRLENLFESFIGLINAAIDDKSPYTSGHCERVPILTMMLADAVDNCKVGPLKDFTMSERDRHELKIAGLLHDCGKVTTPVHVVDKATKLQTHLRPHRSGRHALRGHPARRRARAAAGAGSRRCRTATGEALAAARARLRGAPAPRSTRTARFCASCNIGAEVDAPGGPGAGAADFGQVPLARRRRRPRPTF